MPRYKRNATEAELDIPAEPQRDPKDEATLSTLRNMWEFASFMQYIGLFGSVVKIDQDFDIEELEAECLRPQPAEKLNQMGLAMLKYVSSHRGLTPEIFDEYTRRQYEAKAASRNPFGIDEEPKKFADFDIFTKIRVLQQLSTWTLGNANKIREAMPEGEDDLGWRMEPFGWDKEDRTYFVLDDDRLYRRTDPPLPSEPVKKHAKTKAKSKSKSKSKPNSTKATKSSKRMKLDTPEAEEDDDEAELGAIDDTTMPDASAKPLEIGEDYGDGLGGMTWECVAITLEEYQHFLSSIFRSRDLNEKRLHAEIESRALPILEKRAEAQRQKALRRMRELGNLQKLATAKRSGRLADKAEKERQDLEVREAEKKKKAELRMAHEELERQRQMEEDHDTRRLTREQRIKEREVKRILAEERLAKLEEDSERAASQDPNSTSDAGAEKKRTSGRQIKAEKQKHKEQLEKIQQEVDQWEFDCSVCGKHGKNWDDGEHAMACEKCSVWQHSSCHGVTQEQASADTFHFVCGHCQRKVADAKKPKIPPLKLGKSRGTSGSPKSERTTSRPASSGLPPHVIHQLNGVQVAQQQPNQQRPPSGHHQQPVMNGPSLSPHGQSHGPPGYHYYASGHPQPGTPQQAWQGSPLPPPQWPGSQGYYNSPPQPMRNDYGPPQQHQYAHQSAVASTGFPSPQYNGYRAPPPQQPNGYPSQGYPMHGGMPPNQYPMDYRRPSYPPQPPQYGQQPHQQQHPPSSAQPQLMNGFQSPTKPKQPPPSASSPNHYQQKHQSPSPSNQQIERSPNTSFPPPMPDGFSVQRAGHSPVKSSPSPTQQQHQPYQPPMHQKNYYLQYQQTPHQPPTNFRPPSSNGHQPPPQHLQTPQMRPTSANGTPASVKQDGMAGPWPAAANTIPEKHDTSPGPPSSSQSTGEKRIIPPIAALSPSPSQAPQDNSVPVKKLMPEPELPQVNGDANRTTQAPSPAAPAGLT